MAASKYTESTHSQLVNPLLAASHLEEEDDVVGSSDDLLAVDQIGHVHGVGVIAPANVGGDFNGRLLRGADYCLRPGSEVS